MIYIVVAVIVVVAVVAYLLLAASSGSSLIGKPVSHANLASLQAIANNNTLAQQVGSGVALAGSNPSIPKPIKAPAPLIVDGKPEILYIGGEFCPYCAVTRWSLVLALMRFGTFTNLTYMQSSPTDVDADTATFSFSNYSYHSNLISFNGVEIYDRQGNAVNSSAYTPLDELIVSKYGEGIPFIDFVNQSVQSGAVVSPQYLAGENWDQIIAAMNNSGNPISQAEIGTANLFTAQICMSNSTLNSTAPVCKEQYVKTLISTGH